MGKGAITDKQELTERLTEFALCGVSANISTRSVFPTSDRSKTAVPYLAGLRDFASNYCQETSDSELRDNVIQLYLRQVHSYYKNRWHLRRAGMPPSKDRCRLSAGLWARGEPGQGNSALISLIHPYTSLTRAPRPAVPGSSSERRGRRWDSWEGRQS